MTDLFGNTTPEPMRSLTWKEPYASLMLYGKIETRTWETDYRGLVLIHSARSPYKKHEIWGLSEKQSHRISSLLTAKRYKHMHTSGNAIAVGRLVHCRRMEEKDEDLCFVKYDPSLYCHIYTDIRPIRMFPYSGKQGWSSVPEDIIKRIIYR